MKIVERVPSNGPTDSGGEQVKPRTWAIIAVVLTVAALMAGVIAEGPLSGAIFGLAFGLALFTAMIAGAFELDRRRRLNYLRGN